MSLFLLPSVIRGAHAVYKPKVMVKDKKLQKLKSAAGNCVTNASLKLFYQNGWEVKSVLCSAILLSEL